MVRPSYHYTWNRSFLLKKRQDRDEEHQPPVKAKYFFLINVSSKLRELSVQSWQITADTIMIYMGR